MLALKQWALVIWNRGNWHVRVVGLNVERVNNTPDPLRTIRIPHRESGQKKTKLYLISVWSAFQFASVSVSCAVATSCAKKSTDCVAVFALTVAKSSMYQTPTKRSRRRREHTWKLTVQMTNQMKVQTKRKPRKVSQSSALYFLIRVHLLFEESSFPQRRPRSIPSIMGSYRFCHWNQKWNKAKQI